MKSKRRVNVVNVVRRFFTSRARCMPKRTFLLPPCLGVSVVTFAVGDSKNEYCSGISQNKFWDIPKKFLGSPLGLSTRSWDSFWDIPEQITRCWDHAFLTSFFESSRDVFRRLVSVVHPWIRYRLAGNCEDWQDAGPDGQVVVLFIVDRRAGADFCRRFFERELEHGGRLQFRVVWSADFGPSSAHQVLGDGLQGFCFVCRIFYLAGRSERHHGAVVHRVMEGGARQNDSVHESYREACRYAALS